MQLTPRDRLTQFHHLLQSELFPIVETAVGDLSSQARLLVSTLGLISMSRWLPPTRGSIGRPMRDRQACLRAFVAKAIYNFQTTRQLLERLRADDQLRRLCGWDSLRQLPHESTFSRPLPSLPALRCRSVSMRL
jgi:hypothetical protein